MCVVSSVLTHIAGNLLGLLETMTALCAAPVGATIVRGNVKERRSVFPALILVLQEFIGADARQAPLSQALQQIDESSQKMLDAIESLLKFRDVTLDELRNITDLIGASQLQAFAAIRTIAEDRGVDVRYLHLPAWREEYYTRIRERLFDIFKRERETPGNFMPANDK
jgi:signal transduction histidine kinase